MIRQRILQTNEMRIHVICSGLKIKGYKSIQRRNTKTILEKKNMKETAGIFPRNSVGSVRHPVQRLWVRASGRSLSSWYKCPQLPLQMESLPVTCEERLSVTYGTQEHSYI